jgi:hypothetical protein
VGAVVLGCAVRAVVMDWRNRRYQDHGVMGDLLIRLPL